MTSNDSLDPTQPTPTAKPAARISTIVWGLLLGFVGVLLILTALGYRFDMQIVLIIGLGVAGVVLLAGSLTRALRQ